MALLVLICLNISVAGQAQVTATAEVPMISLSSTPGFMGESGWAINLYAGGWASIHILSNHPYPVNSSGTPLADPSAVNKPRTFEVAPLSPTLTKLRDAAYALLPAVSTYNPDCATFHVQCFPPGAGYLAQQCLPLDEASTLRTVYELASQAEAEAENDP